MIPPKVQFFIDDVKRECRRLGVKFTMARSNHVVIDHNILCSGYFDSQMPELAVARKRDEWLSILVHESCHMDQWKENIDIWKAEDKCGNNVVDRWLIGKEVKNLRKAINRVIALELDCEKRSLKKIAQYDLPINTTTYIQKANAYLLFHYHVLRSRTWSDPKSSPHSNPDIYTKMPAKFMSEGYYKRFHDKFEQIFIEAGL